MYPFEKYDIVFNVAMSSRMQKSSPGQYKGEDNGLVLALIYTVIIDFDTSIMKYPSIKRFLGGASNDLMQMFRILETRYPVLISHNRNRNAPMVSKCGLRGACWPL